MKRLCCSSWLPSLVARPCPGAASFARSQSRRYRIFASMCIMLMVAISAQAFSPTLSPPTPLFSFFSSFSLFFFQNCVLFFLFAYRVCHPSTLHFGMSACAASSRGVRYSFAPSTSQLQPPFLLFSSPCVSPPSACVAARPFPCPSFSFLHMAPSSNGPSYCSCSL